MIESNKSISKEKIDLWLSSNSMSKKDADSVQSHSLE